MPKAAVDFTFLGAVCLHVCRPYRSRLRQSCILYAVASLCFMHGVCAHLAGGAGALHEVCSYHIRIYIIGAKVGTFHKILANA